MYAGEILLAELATESSAEIALDFPGGSLTLQAESTFYMEGTGAAHDTGTWLQVTREGVSLV